MTEKPCAMTDWADRETRVREILAESGLDQLSYRMDYLRDSVIFRRFGYELSWELVIDWGPDRLRENHYRMLGSLA